MSSAPARRRTGVTLTGTVHISEGSLVRRVICPKRVGIGLELGLGSTLKTSESDQLLATYGCQRRLELLYVFQYSEIPFHG